MNRSTICAITSKWLTILRDYEKIKAGDFSVFKKVNHRSNTALQSERLKYLSNHL